jgi:hypothetical protein
MPEVQFAHEKHLIASQLPNIRVAERNSPPAGQVAVPVPSVHGVGIVTDTSFEKLLSTEFESTAVTA